MFLGSVILVITVSMAEGSDIPSLSLEEVYASALQKANGSHLEQDIVIADRQKDKAFAALLPVCPLFTDIPGITLQTV
jgi:hypothetical protein